MNPVVKVLLKCVIRYSISFRWYAFLYLCTQISNPGLVKFFISISDTATFASFKEEELGAFVWFSILQYRHFGRESVSNSETN